MAKIRLTPQDMADLLQSKVRRVLHALDKNDVDEYVIGDVAQALVDMRALIYAWQAEDGEPGVTTGG